jgi:hypothetical protein
MFDRNVTAAPHIILSQRPITFADIYLQLNSLSQTKKGRNLFKLFQQWRNCLIYLIRTLATCEFLYFIFPPVVDWNLFLMYRLCLVFFVCVAGLAYGRKRSLCYPKKKKMKMEMNLNTKCKEAAFFVGRWDRGDTHTHTRVYVYAKWGSNPLLYICACAAASFLWCRWWIFFFSSFSLGDIFLPLVDLDLKKKIKIIEKEFFSLPSVCKKELNTAPKEEEEKKTKILKWNSRSQGVARYIGYNIYRATVGARLFSFLHI